MKKFLALVLALAMVMSLGVLASADDFDWKPMTAQPFRSLLLSTPLPTQSHPRSMNSPRKPASR